MGGNHMTNGERFRGQTDEELAEFLSCYVTILDCPREVWDAQKSGMSYADAWLHWLRLPSKPKRRKK